MKYQFEYKIIFDTKLYLKQNKINIYIQDCVFFMKVWGIFDWNNATLIFSTDEMLLVINQSINNP